MKDPADHYEYLADFLAKTAIVAEGALIFGQFVPGFGVNWVALSIGSLLTIVAIRWGYVLKKKSYHLGHIIHQ